MSTELGTAFARTSSAIEKAHAYAGPSSADKSEGCPAAPLYQSIVSRYRGFLKNYICYKRPHLVQYFEKNTKAADHGTYLHSQQEAFLVDGVVMDIEDDFERSMLERICEEIKDLMDVTEEFGIEDRLFNDGVDSFGTADFWAVFAADTKAEAMVKQSVEKLYEGVPIDCVRLLNVRDLKTGRGEVHSEDNKQGMRYACGVMEKLGWPEDITHLKITIDAVQFPSTSWVITHEQLKDYWLNVFRPSMYANNGLAPKPVAGLHCKWCEAKVHCREFHEFMGIPVMNKVVEIGMENVDTEELEDLYLALQIGVNMIDDLKAELLARQEEYEFLGTGGLTKLREQSGAKRSYVRDAKIVEAAIKELPKEVQDQMYTRSLKNPAAIRTILKGQDKSVLERVNRGIVDTTNKSSLKKVK